MTQGALTGISAPEGWTYRPLWAVAPRVVEKGYPNGEPLSVFLGDGVVPRSQRIDNHNELGADLSAYLHVMPGDLVFNKLRTWQGGLGVSAHEGIVSPAYFVCRPDASVWPRYLHYLLTSAPYRAELTRLSKWMPPSQFDIPWEMLRSVPLLLPAWEEQRRIAEFLDRRVALIDRAVSLRAEQRVLLAERYEAEVEQRIRPDGASTSEIPARFLVSRIGVGIVIQPAALYTEGDDGVPAVRGKDISPGEIAPIESLVKITREGHDLNRRSTLQAGDIVVVRSGKAGAAAEVPEHLVGGNCIDVVIVRPGSLLDPRYLEYSINCRRAQETIAEHSVGALQRHFGVEDMKALPIVPRDLAAQRTVGRSLDGLTDKRRRTEALLDESIDLLKARKEALITAAVTGAFDVTAARSAA